MSVHLTTGDRERALLAQKDKIFEKHQALCDIPEEKALYQAELRRLEVDDVNFKKNPQGLRWMLTRLQFRIQEAKREIESAFEHQEGGVVNLAGKMLCDLTAGELYPYLRDVWKIDLSGNYLKSLPLFCLLKPMIERIDGSGNLADIEAQFYTFRQDNRVSIDLFHFLKACLELQEEPTAQLVAIVRDIDENPLKLPLVELAARVHHSYFHSSLPHKILSIHPKERGGIRIGEISTFIELNPFKDLEVLDLSHLRLEHRAPLSWLEGLVNLKVLNLSHTTLKELPIKAKDLVNLQTLDISYTGIVKLPDWMGDLVTLKKVVLSGTQIRTLPESFQNLELNELILDGVPMTQLKYVSSKTKNISLVGASVCSIPRTIAPLWKKHAIIIGEGSHESLFLQQRIYNQYTNTNLASSFLGFYERRRGESPFLPTSVQVHFTAIQVILFISFLSIMHFGYSLMIPCRVACLSRQDFAALQRRYPRLLNEPTPCKRYRGSVLAHMAMMGQYFRDLWVMLFHIRYLYANS